VKTGRLSKEEWQYIEENAEVLSVEEIANNLDRDQEPIIKHLKRMGLFSDRVQSLETQAEYDLRSKPDWEELKKQFNEQELKLFLHHWSQIIAQFRNDVLKTEQLQIIDLIKLDILMNRALRGQKQSEDDIVRLEEILIEKKLAASDVQDRDEIFSLERNIASLRASKEALSRDMKDLYSKKEATFKNLKATREQRIQKLESNKVTMAGLIEKILRNPQFYEEQGKQIEKMRLAMEKEKIRISDFHTYEDGSIDQPFLNADTVL